MRKRSCRVNENNAVSLPEQKAEHPNNSAMIRNNQLSFARNFNTRFHLTFAIDGLTATRTIG
jgi:hypothetical protein